MTVSRQTPIVIYLGNGLARDWALTFPVLKEEHLKLVLSSPENEITQIPQTEYQVDLSASSVRYPLDGVEPLPNGWKIAVLRETPIDQGIDLVNNGGMFPEVLESGLDKLSMIAQEIEVKMARAVMVPETADDPVGFGKLILSGAERAESAAVRAESSAGSAGGHANAARMARDKALEAQEKAESEADRAEAEGVKASECMIAAESSKNQAVIEATKAEAAADRAESAASGIGGGSVASVVGKYPDESGNIALVASDVGAPALNHSHTLQALGAASVGHSHTAQDVGAASITHNHDGNYIQKPTVTAADAGKALLVKSDGSGWTVGAASGGGSGVAGVSSLNGKTGDVTLAGAGIATVKETGNVLTVDVPAPAFPVTSVNGKTGAVVIATGGDGSGGGWNFWESGDVEFTLDTFTYLDIGFEIENPKECIVQAFVKYIGTAAIAGSFKQNDIADFAANNIGMLTPLSPVLSDNRTIKIWSGRNGVYLQNKVPTIAGSYITLSSDSANVLHVGKFRYIFRIWYK